MLVYFDLKNPKYLPKCLHFGDAGLDLVAAETVSIRPRQSADIPVGVEKWIPNDFNCVGLVVPRSSWFAKGLLCLSVIDSGYRKPWYVRCWNVSDHTIMVYEGERFAQLIVFYYVPITIITGREKGVRE